MEEVKRFVGIDVAKVALEVFIGSAGGAFSVANDEVGIRELLRQMKPADFVIVEATGGLETPVASALAAAGIAVAIVNLKAKKILAGRDRLIEENGPLVRCIECVAHATRRDTGGPRDAVEGRAVEAASQAGSADRIWS